MTAAAVATTVTHRTRATSPPYTSRKDEDPAEVPESLIGKSAEVNTSLMTVPLAITGSPPHRVGKFNAPLHEDGAYLALTGVSVAVNSHFCAGPKSSYEYPMREPAKSKSAGEPENTKNKDPHPRKSRNESEKMNGA